MKKQFQFHYGTIKSTPCQNRTCKVDNFNSIMVRLKAVALNYLRVEVVDFNSIMVRLKGAAVVVGVIVVVFQFHYGTIKRCSEERLIYYRLLFQFHYGTIKSFCFLPLFSAPCFISIPLWYD